MHDFADMILKACSHFCGQGRCFEVDGQALPVCQRCLGLYLGAIITFAWLIVSGLWRSGLPGRRIIILHAAALLTAGAGGLHFIDAGANWRLVCGVLTGHVTTFWLVAGTVQLCGKERPADTKKNTRVAEIQALAMPILLSVLSACFGCPSFLTWWPLTVMVCLGIAILWSLAAAATLILIYRVGSGTYARFLTRTEKT